MKSTRGKQLLLIKERFKGSNITFSTNGLSWMNVLDHITNGNLVRRGRTMFLSSCAATVFERWKNVTMFLSLASTFLTFGVSKAFVHAKFNEWARHGFSSCYGHVIGVFYDKVWVLRSQIPFWESFYLLMCDSVRELWLAVCNSTGSMNCIVTVMNPWLALLVHTLVARATLLAVFR